MGRRVRRAAWLWWQDHVHKYIVMQVNEDRYRLKPARQLQLHTVPRQRPVDGW